jgi:AcrR family transcriptional regulator
MAGMVRSYSSPARTAQALRTRADVVAAAHDLFVSEGWVGTTMAGVAERAGVARQTVYLMFESKTALLDVCIDQRLRGSGADAPVRTQSGYRAMGTGTLTERVAAGARWLAAAHERSAVIQRVLDQAAVTDPVAAARLGEREGGRWQEVAFAVRQVLGNKPSREFIDLVWTLASRDVWLKLVEQRGWTTAQWQRWFEQALTAAIAATAASEGPAPS